MVRVSDQSPRPIQDTTSERPNEARQTDDTRQTNEAGAPATNTATDPGDTLERGGTTRTSGRAPHVDSRPAAGGLRAGDLARADNTRRVARVQPEAPRSPPTPPYNPGRDANELYESMNGGIFGAGTDEDRLFAALDGKSPQQIDALRREYRDHYDRDLDADIRSELSGSELRRAQNLLRGDQNAAAADTLHQAMKGGTGMGTDEAAIFRTLEGRSASERAAIERSYESRYGAPLRNHLRDELSGSEEDRALSLLDGNTADADAARLHQAMRGGVTGLGTDEDGVYATLGNRSAEDRAAIESSYRRQYGRELRSDIGNELSSAELDRANALLDGDQAGAAAAQVEHAMSGGVFGMGTDERAIESAFEGRSASERAAIEQSYSERYGDLDANLRSELNSTDLRRANTFRDSGGLTDAQRVYYATQGLGTDEDAIRQSLQGRSREEIAQIRADYRSEFNRDIDADLSGDLSGRGAFDANMWMRGRPESTREAVDRMNERWEYERGGITNAISSGFVDMFSDQGELLDRNVARANARYREATSQGGMSARDRADVNRMVGWANMDVETYRTAKDSVAETTGTVAATAASVAVVVGTAGSAAPAVVGLYAAGAGAATRVVTSAAIQGRGYGVENVAGDAAVGAVDGAFTVVGAGAGNAAARSFVQSSARSTLRRGGVQNASRELLELSSREVLERSATRRMAAGSIQGSVDGAIGGAAGGAAQEAFRDGTWDQGVAQGLGRVGQGAAMGVAGGVVAGGAMGGVTGGFSRTQGLINDDVLLNRHSMGNNHWHTVGTYDDMVTVNRAFDGQPRRVEVSSPSGNQSVEVFGARNAREAATVQDALQRMRDVGADAGIPQQVHLRTDIGAITDAAGRRQGGIGGLGGDGTTMIVARDQLTNGRSAAHVIHHEAGHNVDTAFGRLTDTARGRALFGQGDSVSPYGALNRAEDFAETHRVLIRDWDRIMAEPDRYLDGSDIGRKLTFILDEVYGVNPRANAGGAAPAPATPSVRPQRSRIAPSGEAPTWRDVGEQHRTFLEAERRLATETRRLEHAQARLQTLQDGVADIEPRAYTNPGHHDPTSPNFRGGGSMTTHLPRDAEEVFARAIPEPGRHGDSWWARADSGDWYRYQGGRGDAVHWNGATGRTGGARAIQAHDVPGDIQTRWRLEQEMSGLQQRVGGLAEGVEDARFMYEYAESEFSDAANAVLRETGRPIDDSLRGMSWSQLRAVARDRGAGDLRTQARWLLDQVQARNPE